MSMSLLPGLLLLTLAAPFAPMAAAAPVPLVQAGVAGTTVKGRVIETLDAASYTYVRLQTADGEAWAAVKQTQIVVGQQVTVVNAAAMGAFESKALGRTFDQIYFGTLDEPTAELSEAEQQAAIAAAHQAAARTPVGSPHGQPVAATQAAGRIEKATGPNGRTVAELWAQKDDLDGKPVAVRGKVVKFSAQIMGKNWIHLRDGSGTREAKDDDITITTSDDAAVGDVILVEGVLRKDKDFGSGYLYPVIVEEAKLTR